MKYSKIFEEELNKGNRGENQGIPHRFKRLKNYIPSIQKGTYYLVTGESGSGKTSFADDVFIDNVLEWYLENKHQTDIIPDLNVFSFEIKLKDKLAKLAARKIYRDYNILLDINYIYQRGIINRIPDEIRDICKRYVAYFDEIQDYLTIYNKSMNPTGIHKLVQKKALYYGEEHVQEDGIITYTNKKPNTHVIWMLDHFDKLRGENSKDGYLDGKGKIDKCSMYFVDDKNLYDHTFVPLQQINREVASAQRSASIAGKSNKQIRLQTNDLKGTGNPVEDADFVIGIFSPNKYEIEEYDGYKIVGKDADLPLRNRFRSIQLLKGRDGESDINCPTLYVGEIGRFYELPQIAAPKVYESVAKKKKYDNSEYLKSISDY